jgi:putative tricarboxylic transport membrane protein
MRLGRDGLAGLIGLCVSILLIWQSFALPSSPLVPVGPGFYPRIVLVLLALASLALIVQDRLAARARSASPPDAGASVAGSVSDYGRVGLGFAVVTVYILLLPYLGYRLATVVFVVAMQVAVERPRTVMQWLVALGIAVATAAVTYLVFERYLSVLLPRGVWTGW